MPSYEDQVRRELEQVCPIDEDISADLSLAYPRSQGLRDFASQSKKLRKIGLKGQRPKAAQRKPMKGV